MNFIGIDPGKSGGIAVLYDEARFGGETLRVLSLKDATERDVWDFLYDNALCEMQATRDYFAVIEKVASSPQMGVTSAFSFGRSLGFLRGLVTASRTRFDEVSPQKWQKAMGCLSGGDKNKTKAKAQQLFPGVKVTHAIADALLIAEYSRRTYGEIYAKGANP